VNSATSCLVTRRSARAPIAWTILSTSVTRASVISQVRL
jgi:hypothetical protein